MGNLRCVLVCLVVLQVAIKSTSGNINKEDVEKCIAGTKLILLNQKNETERAFDVLKNQTFNQAQTLQDKKYVSLDTTIRKERGVLYTFKQSAVNDQFDVSACNDSSAIYELVEKSFNVSTLQLAAEFRGIMSRNYIQHQSSLNQLAQTYTQLEQKLNKCGKTETVCFEGVQNDCLNLDVQDAMENLEPKFSAACESTYLTVLTPKMEALYKRKTGDVNYHTQKIKACYRLTKNSNGTDTNKNDGISIRYLNFLMILPILFIVLL